MSNNYISKYDVQANEVHSTLSKFMLADGFEIVVDLEKSNGINIYDKKNDKWYLDFFTCFASLPIGFNHPSLTEKSFVECLGQVAVNKPSNSDVYTEELATFVKTFFKVAVPKEFKHSFFVSGGGLAVENALKVAFDWKVRKNIAAGKEEKGSKIIHFTEAFHGRTGYTMSLTNTSPDKVMYFPKFDWPRIDTPKIHSGGDLTVEQREALAISQIEKAFSDNPDDIAAIILEPIQGEGGDNHFRKEFFEALRKIADEKEALLIFDEVQTGLGLTGSWWAHERIGVTPDIMTFGKKMQVCGIIATDRIDEVEDHVFVKSSRINSTWGGNLVDMVRVTKYLEVIEENNYIENAKKQGDYLLSKLEEFQSKYPNLVTNARGLGLLAAFDVKNDKRDEFLKHVHANGVIILSCGETSVRFRPPINVTKDELDKGLTVIEKALSEL
jgi:L-lysine 6-transaminase